MSIKITNLELENVKRVKAVQIVPKELGLTIMAGNNNQGKTSILDAIAWAVGGNKFKPSKPTRDGSAIPPKLKVELSNGLVVERGGVNSDLKVIDPSGNKAGQTLLDSFISEFALDIPKFLNQNSKDKAKTLLKVIGVGDKLFELDNTEEKLMAERRLTGQQRDQKVNYAEGLTHHDDAPKELVSMTELLEQQQTILAKNGENNRLRQNAQFIESNHKLITDEYQRALKEVEIIKSKLDASLIDLETAQKSALDLHDESTEELEKSLKNIELINNKVKDNLNREVALDEANNYINMYENMSHEIEALRKNRLDLLNDADLPLEGLSVEKGELTFNGHSWDNMSGSEQLRVATAIVRKLNPECGFVLLDKLEQFDQTQLKEFGEWLETENLQAIGTRVGASGDDCEIIIEDGYVKSETVGSETPAEETKEGWTF